MLVDHANDRLTSEIQEISFESVRTAEMYQIYTDSGTFIANGILASCKAHGDGSDFFLPPLAFLSNYISPTSPQLLSDIFRSLRLPRQLYYLIIDYLT